MVSLRVKSHRHDQICTCMCKPNIDQTLKCVFFCTSIALIHSQILLLSKLHPHFQNHIKEADSTFVWFLLFKHWACSLCWLQDKHTDKTNDMKEPSVVSRPSFKYMWEHFDEICTLSSGPNKKNYSHVGLMGSCDACMCWSKFTDLAST